MCFAPLSREDNNPANKWSLREAAKKVLLLMAGPLRGGGRKVPGH